MATLARLHILLGLAKVSSSCKQLINLKSSKPTGLRGGGRGEQRNGLPRSDQMKSPQGLEKRLILASAAHWTLP